MVFAIWRRYIKSPGRYLFVHFMDDIKKTIPPGEAAIIIKQHLSSHEYNEKKNQLSEVTCKGTF